MSVVALVLLSMTPIAAMGILIGIGRFERYLLEGNIDGNVADQWSSAAEEPHTGAIAPAAAPPAVAHPSRTAA